MTSSIAAHSSRAVAAAIDRLDHDYGAVEVIDRHWSVGGDRYETLAHRVAQGTLGGAGAWVTNDRGEVLLVRREASPDVWSEPSGHHEPGERLQATARREVREETGIDCRIGGVACCQHVRYKPPARAAIHRVIVVFTADRVAGTPRPEPGEIRAVKWWDHHPESLLYEALGDLPIPAA